MREQVEFARCDARIEIRSIVPENWECLAFTFSVFEMEVYAPLLWVLG